MYSHDTWRGESIYIYVAQMLKSRLYYRLGDVRKSSSEGISLKNELLIKFRLQMLSTSHPLL